MEQFRLVFRPNQTKSCCTWTISMVASSSLWWKTHNTKCRPHYLLKKRSNRPLETLSAITESFSKFAFVFWTTKTTTKYIKTSSLSGAAACWMVTVETNGGSRTGGHVDSQGGSIPEPLCAVPRQEKQQQRAGAMATPTPFSFPPLRILCSE